VGVVEEGIWSRVLEVVKRRAKDVVEKVGTGGDEEEEMDVDGMDNGKRKKEGRKREVDGILSEIFGGMRVGEGGSKEVWAGEREREELVNGGTAAALVSLLSVAGIEDVGEDLYVSLVSASTPWFERELTRLRSPSNLSSSPSEPSPSSLRLSLSSVPSPTSSQSTPLQSQQQVVPYTRLLRKCSRGNEDQPTSTTGSTSSTR